MQYILLIFLSLSLPAMAQDATLSSQEKVKPSSEKEDLGKPTILCDPYEETRMPKTFN
jgi:hypothetical protein